MGKYFVTLKLTEEMKRIEKEILNLLPSESEEAMAIIIHLYNTMKEHFGVNDEAIIEKTEAEK